MSRLSDAWAALCGRPRVVTEVRTDTILGSPEPCELYAVDRVTGVEIVGVHDFHFPTEKITRLYYATCEQAFKENPRSKVIRVQMFRIGGRYLTGLQVKEVRLQPKPKRAKGARA